MYRVVALVVLAVGVALLASLAWALFGGGSSSDARWMSGGRSATLLLVIVFIGAVGSFLVHRAARAWRRPTPARARSLYSAVTLLVFLQLYRRGG